MPDLGTRLRSQNLNPGLPPVSQFLLRAFAQYTRWYLRRHFHSLRIHRSGWLPDNENAIPKVIYLNHPSWWDPLVCLHLARNLFARHHAYAPIDARAVEKYAFFKRLGFFGVENDTPRGAASFFRVAHQVLGQPWHMLWVTPQARFADIRERPVRFKNGLGLLASRIARPYPHSTSITPPNRVQFVPLAIEYAFWQERLPEILLHFGEPLEVHTATAHLRSPEDWTATLELRLETAMNALAEASTHRQTEAFLPWLRGHSGVGGIYDHWRRLHSKLRGRPFDPNHGSL